MSGEADAIIVGSGPGGATVAEVHLFRQGLNDNGQVAFFARLDDGTEVELPEGSELAEPLGELIKAVLLKARGDGMFAGLPKAAGCELGVEH